MRHVFYPAIVDRVGEHLVLRMPDLSVIQDVPPDTDPYVFAILVATSAIEALRKSEGSLALPSPLASFCGRKPVPEMLFQVPVAVYRDYVRVGLTMDPMLLHRVDEAANRRSMSRTAFLSMAATAMIEDEMVAA